MDLSEVCIGCASEGAAAFGEFCVFLCCVLFLSSVVFGVVVWSRCVWF